MEAVDVVDSCRKWCRLGLRVWGGAKVSRLMGSGSGVGVGVGIGSVCTLASA